MRSVSLGPLYATAASGHLSDKTSWNVLTMSRAAGLSPLTSTIMWSLLIRRDGMLFVYIHSVLLVDVPTYLVGCDGKSNNFRD